jgi:hypothetical protein
MKGIDQRIRTHDRHIVGRHRQPIHGTMDHPYRRPVPAAWVG